MAKNSKVRVQLPEGPREVTFERDSLEVRFQSNPEEPPVSVRFQEIQPGLYRVVLGNRQEIVAVEPGADQVVVQTRYRRYVIPVERVGRQGAVSVAEGEITVKAPMSGLVVDVLKEAGERVQEGEALLVLEAMKMRSEIHAPASGIVKTVHVEPGQSVPPGHHLVVIQVEEV